MEELKDTILYVNWYDQPEARNQRMCLTGEVETNDVEHSYIPMDTRGMLVLERSCRAASIQLHLSGLFNKNAYILDGAEKI